MKTLLTILAVILLSLPVNAQDVHLSQFNGTPLLLNPALTGKLACGSYRADVSYRDQWNSIPAPYRTFAAGFDINLFDQKLKGNSMGAGILAYNDVSGDGNLTNNTVAISAAYHQRLWKRHTLSMGVQGAYVKKSVDIFNLVFGNQIGPTGVIQGSPSGVAYNGPIEYIDLNAGLHWSSRWKNVGFSAGGAYYHILEPEERFLQTTPSLESTLAPRLVLHGGLMASIGAQISLSPSVLYMAQAGVSQINAGAIMGIHWSQFAVFGGLRNRLVSGYSGIENESIIPVAGVEYENFLLGLSYDFSTSGITDANKGRGAFEFSLTYNRCSNPSQRITHHSRF